MKKLGDKINEGYNSRLYKRCEGLVRTKLNDDLKATVTGITDDLYEELEREDILIFLREAVERNFNNIYD